jgi:hypothetical protein
MVTVMVDIPFIRDFLVAYLTNAFEVLKNERLIIFMPFPLNEFKVHSTISESLFYCLYAAKRR